MLGGKKNKPKNLKVKGPEETELLLHQRLEIEYDIPEKFMLVIHTRLPGRALILQIRFLGC